MMKAQILKMCNIAPIKSLVKQIEDGFVTLAELDGAGLSPARHEQIEKYFVEREELVWQQVQANPSLESVQRYVANYPNGKHIYEAKDKLTGLDDEVWRQTEANGSIEAYQQYLKLYPAGRHVAEANEILADPEWAAVKRINTLEAYTNYRNSHPGMHAMAVDDAIQNISDPQDWGVANSAGTPEAFETYIQQHPHGAHVEEAKRKMDDFYWRNACFVNTAAAMQQYLDKMPSGQYIDAARERLDDLSWEEAKRVNTRASMDDYMVNNPNGKHFDEAKELWEALGEREDLLNGLAKDLNYCSAMKINEYLEKHVITKDEVIQFFGPDRADKIFNFSRVPIPAPIGPFLPELQRGPTEVYFWGTPASGKTCALGAVLSTCHSRYVLDGQNCRGYDYMNKLSNVFSKGNGLCSLPDSTANDVIADMVLKIRDTRLPMNRQYPHAMTLIDIAGEIFRAIYADFTNQYLEGQKRQTLNQIQKYLANKNNKKIHFFVVEYGAHDKEWEGNTMSNYLQTCATYLRDKQILKGQTVGVYIIVTKCDKMMCPPEAMPQAALDYVQTHLNAFFVNLQYACREAGIQDFKVISFSVGDVFAQQLCYYNDTYTDKVVDILLSKTPEEKNSFWRS